MTAVGIHAHPKYKLGLAPHNKADHELLSIGWRAGQVPSSPDSVDNMVGVRAGLDNNDKWGICGPTSVDNHNRITTLFEGAEVDAAQADVTALYEAATSPPFNPQTGANDNGVDMATLMDRLKAVGLGGKKIVAYGRLKDTSDPSIFAAIDLFKCVLFAVDLQAAQQAQTGAPKPYWDYKPSSEWGGHAIVAGAYTKVDGRVRVFSWAIDLYTTVAFRQHQLGEVWVPIWPELYTNPKFVEVVDAEALAADFNSLTGGTLSFPVAPPVDPPTPDPVDGELALTIQDEAVIARILHASERDDFTASEYVTHRLRAYFKIKS